MTWLKDCVNLYRRHMANFSLFFPHCDQLIARQALVDLACLVIRGFDNLCLMERPSSLVPFVDLFHASIS